MLHAANPQLVPAVYMAHWSRVLGHSDARLWSPQKTKESTGEVVGTRDQGTQIQRLRVACQPADWLLTLV